VRPSQPQHGTDEQVPEAFPLVGSGAVDGTAPAAIRGRGGSMPSADTEPERVSRLGTMGRAFANRNYRLFFAGQGVSLIGTWMKRKL